MRPSMSYTSTPYRIREYSESPNREPVCQTLSKRLNTSTDHRITRDYYDSQKQTDRSYSSSKTEGLYTVTREPARNETTVIRRYDSNQGSSYISNYSVTSRADNVPIQTPVKIVNGIERPERPQSINKSQNIQSSNLKDKAKVLFIDVESKVEEEVLMELYMRICALSMENERQRLKNAEFLKFQSMLLNLLSIKEDNLRNSETNLKSNGAQIAVLNQTINSLRQENQARGFTADELSAYKTKTQDLEIKQRVLSAENNKLLELKSTHEKEIAIMKQEFLQVNKKLFDSIEKIRGLTIENEKLFQLNRGFREELENKDEQRHVDLNSFDNEKALIKRSYEEKIVQITTLLKTKERETEGFKEELSRLKHQSEQMSTNSHSKQKHANDQMNSYEAKINELKTVVRGLEQRNDDETVILKDSNDKLRDQVIKLQTELQRKEDIEHSQKQVIEKMKSQTADLEVEKYKFTNMIKEKVQNEGKEIQKHLELIESLKQQIELKDEEAHKKQKDYMLKMNEISEKIKVDRNELEHKDELISRLESQLIELQNDHQELRETHEEVITAFNKHKFESLSHVPDVVRKLRSVQQSLEAEKQSMAEALEKQINDLTSKCNHIIEERAQISCELNNFKIRANKEISELREENYTLIQTHNSKISSDDREKATRVNELQTKLAHSERSLNTRVAEINKLSEEVRRLNETILAIDLERNSLEKRISDMRREHTMQLGVFENKLSMQSDRYNQLKHKFDDEVQMYETKIKTITEQTTNFEMKDKSEKKRIAHDALIKQQELNRELLMLKDENGKLRESKDNIKNKLEGLNEEYNKLEEKYKTEIEFGRKSKDADFLRQKLDSLLLKSSEYESSIETYKLESLRFKSKLKETQQRHTSVLAELQHSLEQAENAHSQYRSESEQERFRLTTELDAMQNEAQRLRTKLSRLEETNSQLLTKQKELLNMVDKVEDRELSKRTKAVDIQDRLDAALRSAEQDKKAFETQKLELIESYELKFKKGKDEWSKREQELSENYANLQNRYREAETEIQNVSADKQKLQRIVEQLDASTLSDNTGAENIELRKQLELLEREHRALEDEFNQAEQHFHKTLQDVEEIYTKKVNDYADRMDQLNEELQLYRHTQKVNSSSLKEKAFEYESHFEMLNKQICRLEDQYKGLKVEYDLLESKNQTLSNKNKELERGIENYEDQIEMLKRHLKENEEELKKLTAEFQCNMGAISNWQVNSEDANKENIKLRMLADDRLREIDELSEKRDDALIRVFQLSILKHALEENQ